MVVEFPTELSKPLDLLSLSTPFILTYPYPTIRYPLSTFIQLINKRETYFIIFDALAYESKIEDLEVVGWSIGQSINWIIQ